MKKFFVLMGFLCSILLIVNTFLLIRISWRNYSERIQNEKILQPAPEPSLGERAGKAVGQFQNDAEANYEDFQAKAQLTADELERSAKETSEILKQKAEKTSQEVQIAAQNLLDVINAELVKFNEALKKTREEKTVTP